MPKPQVWNTGRKYTVHGQRIAAIKMADSRVAFVDLDRQISGITIFECPDDNLKDFVMKEYDNDFIEDRLYQHRELEKMLTEACRSI